MPYFPARQSSSLSSSIRNLVAGRGALNGLDQIQIEQLAAKTAHENALTQKIGLEAEALRRAAEDRANPALTTEFASNVAGIDRPSGERLAAHLRGDLEQPSAADQMDAELVGAEAQPFPAAAPNIDPGARRLFQAAMAAAIANRIGTGKSNAATITKAAGDVQDNQVLEQAIDPGTPLGRQNRLVAAVAGKAYQPFRTNAQGTVIDEGTGDLAEGSQLAGAVRRVATARAAAANAAAGASSARRDFIAGPQTALANARTDRVKNGQPATPVAPERVQRMIDMTAQGEYRALKAAYDALPYAEKQKAKLPQLAAIRDQVAARYAQPDTQAEIAEANDAIARGADPAKVRARFRQRRGMDLPEAADTNGDPEE